jgi:hypothetical protein
VFFPTRVGGGGGGAGPEVREPLKETQKAE